MKPVRTAGDDGSGQCQSDGSWPAAVSGSDEPDQGGSCGSPGNGQPDVLDWCRQAQVGDTDEDSESGPGVDAENSWIGQGIAGQRLHEDAGECEGGSGHQAEDRAWNA